MFGAADPPPLPSSPPCKICNLQPAKYTCPQCGHRTCSLPCCRRHKRLYDCTGVRDPTLKLSRRQLATEAAFDRDYNFLTGVERAFENADRDADAFDWDHKPGPSRPPAKGSPFAAALADCGVHIHRAPPGMSRQRLNNTRWMPKRKQVQWTVEWHHPDGTSSLSQHNSKSLPATVYHSEFVEAKIDSPPGNKRRKVKDERDDDNLSANPAHDLTPDGGQQLPIPIDTSGPANNEMPRARFISPQASNTSKPRSVASFRFFLVKPFTKGKEKVLVPMATDKSLYDTLRSQEVFEFPSIKVLREPETGLPDGFVLERDYSGHGIEVVSEADAEDHGGNEQGLEEALAPVKVLDSLQKDIAALAS